MYFDFVRFVIDENDLNYSYETFAFCFDINVYVLNMKYMLKTLDDLFENKKKWSREKKNI